jgi:rhamnulokinase
VRFLHNVMGLWLLSESIRQWERAAGESIDLGQLLAQAAEVEEPVSTFDANDARFLAPGDIPKRIAEYCGEHDVPVPTSRPAYVRAIVESLAAAFAAAVDQAARLSSMQFSVVHVVGGGSQNELLCQLIADRCGQPVLAGPVEATALGNVLVQARAQGILEGDLEVLRSVVAASSEPVRYVPRSPAVASRRMR